MRTLSRRCVYCTLLREESSFNSTKTSDGLQVFELFDKQCEIQVWPALIREYPDLRPLRDVLFELAFRAEPAAPSKAWDNRVRTPLREGQKPDGVTLDGRTLNTAANSRPDRGNQVWAGRKLRELKADIDNRIFPPEPDENPTKSHKEPRPRCQKGDCNKRGEVGDTFCGRCGEAFTKKKKLEEATFTRNLGSGQFDDGGGGGPVTTDAKQQRMSEWAPCDKCGHDADVHVQRGMFAFPCRACDCADYEQPAAGRLTGRPS